jgi:hypothetical protein
MSRVLKARFLAIKPISAEFKKQLLRAAVFVSGF